LILSTVQEEAAAKLAKYRAEVQQLLASIRKEASGSSSSPVSSQLLFQLADQLFASSINLSEFVGLGGVPVVVEAVRALTRSLAVAQQQPQQDMEIQEEEQPQRQQQALQAAALPAMLQVGTNSVLACWILVCGFGL
jgi:Skp family chaperone for outer membrane proteins